MDKTVLNSELIATKAGAIIIYNYDGETREYIFPHQMNILLSASVSPACSCLDTPVHISWLCYLALWI